MAPVKNEEDEMNENVPKLLCQMDNHFGGFDAIFFVTFSQNVFLLLKQYELIIMMIIKMMMTMMMVMVMVTIGVYYLSIHFFSLC